jgi:hypothetical protein
LLWRRYDLLQAFCTLQSFSRRQASCASECQHWSSNPCQELLPQLMAATHTWATAKAPRRKSKNVKQALANGNNRNTTRRFVEGALHFSSTMRKPKSNNEGKDRLKALAAAAARAAGANLTTYFADDDGRGSGKPLVRHFDCSNSLNVTQATDRPAPASRHLNCFRRIDWAKSGACKAPMAEIYPGSATLEGRQLPTRMCSPEPSSELHRVWRRAI